MTQTHSRYIQVGDWYFEIKAVRALKVDEYGKPYQAIANCNINGNKMYVDGLLTKNGEEFTKQDFLSIYHFCQKIGIDVCTYHRFQNGESIHRELLIDPNKKIDLSPTPRKDGNDELTQEAELAPVPMRLVK